MPSMTMNADDPVAVAMTQAIQTGDTAALARLLAQHSDLAIARMKDDRGHSRTWLHVATDWPGHFPNGPATVRALTAAGADVNARFDGPHAETPLHWAASSNDVAVLDALIDAGADIEAPGGVIGGGTPLADARGFANWDAASRLLARGARTTLTDAATLGLLDRVVAACEADPRPTPDQITRAFWGACHGGQRAAAEYLLALGADINWIGHGHKTPLDITHASAAEGLTPARDLVPWLRDRGAKTVQELRP